MDSPSFVNPFTNVIFTQTVQLLVVLFIVSLLLLLLFAKGNVKALFASNVGQRYVGWLIITPLYLIGIFFGRIPGLLILTLLVLVAMYEVVKITQLSKLHTWTLFILSVLSVYVTSYQTQFFYALPLLYFSTLSFMAVRLNNKEKSLWNAVVGLFIAVWIIYGLCHVILLSKLNNQLDPHRVLMILVIFAVCVSDIGSYVFGKLFHNLHLFDTYKIASEISPNKTYAGMIGQIIGALAVIIFFLPLITRYLPFYQWIILGILIGLFAASGGMINSMFKRYFHTKDSGHLIPGHGGVLDRVDSLIRVVVVVYYFFSLFLHR